MTRTDRTIERGEHYESHAEKQTPPLTKNRRDGSQSPSYNLVPKLEFLRITMEGVVASGYG